MRRYLFLLALLAGFSSCLNLVNYSGKGYEAYQAGNLESAEQFFRQAIKKKPRDPIAHNNLGTVLLDLDKPEEAIRLFKLAVVLDKNRTYADPHINLARAYFEQGKLDLALESGEKAKTLSSGNPANLLILANIYCAKNIHLPEARDFARDATRTIGDIDQAAAWSTLAEAEYKLGRVDEAMLAIDTAIAFDTDNAFYRQQKALYKP